MYFTKGIAEEIENDDYEISYIHPNKITKPNYNSHTVPAGSLNP